MSLPQVQPQSNLGSTINKTIAHAAANTLQTSKDIQVVKTAAGTTLRVNSQYKDQASLETMRYKGEWDSNAAYSQNDVVRVRPNVSYDSGSISYPVSPGVFICVVPIPDKRVSDQLTALGYASNPTYAPYIRSATVRYFPMYPEPSERATYWNAEGAYWELISSLPVERWTCADGVAEVHYIDMTVSGSTTV
jgi:hypothetical protein